MKLDQAAVALSVRLQNGLLGEAFMGLHRHLAAVTAVAPPAAAPELAARHARLLVGQLLRFAATTSPSAVHAVIRPALWRGGGGGEGGRERRRGAWAGGGAAVGACLCRAVGGKTRQLLLAGPMNLLHLCCASLL